MGVVGVPGGGVTAERLLGGGAVPRGTEVSGGLCLAEAGVGEGGGTGAG